MVNEISMLSNIEAVAQLLLRAFSQINVDNQEQRAQNNDLKRCEFGQKGRCSEVVDCKGRVEEMSVVEKEQDIKMD